MARNVILVTIDDLRRQEVFRGLDERLLVEEDNSLGSGHATQFGADTRHSRAGALMQLLP